MENAPTVWFPLIGPFTGHGCFPSRYMSMRIAASHINRRDATFCPAIADLSNRFQIRYDLADTRSNGIGAASAVLGFLGGANASQVVVVLGPNGSGASKATSQILSVFNVAQMSWASTSADLSNKASYPYYFRSVSPDSLLMRVLVDFVSFLGYAQVNLIYFDATYQSGQATDFRLAAEGNDQVQVLTYRVPHSGEGGNAINAENKIAVRNSLMAIRETVSRVVVAATMNEEAFDLWTEADALGMVHSSGWLWLSTDGVSGSQINGDPDRLELFSGTIYIISSSRGPHFQDYAAKWAADMPTTEVPEFTTMGTCLDGEVCQGLPAFTGWVNGTHDTELMCTGYTALAYDALVTLAVVADRLLAGTDGQTRTPESLTREDWFEGLRSLHTTGHSFHCLSGEIAYNENFERPLPMDFLNWQSGNMQPQLVARWSAVSGYSWNVGRGLQWPDGSYVNITQPDVAPEGRPSGRNPDCSVGTVYSANLSRCVECPEGFRGALLGVERVECVPCDPGTYQPMPGQQSCLPCPAGYASNRSGLANCSEDAFRCAAGQFSPEPGTTECIECPIGRRNPTPASRTCVLCEEGTYQNTTGGVTCTSCETVLSGSDSPRGADRPGECNCPYATMRSPRTSSCEDCPEGLVCPGGDAPPLHAAGFWAEELEANSREYSVVRCRSQLECPKGPIGSCQFGREGRACNDCKPMHHKGSRGRCEECQGVDFLPLLFLVLGLAAVAVVIIVTIRLDPIKQNLTLVTVMATAGQLVIVVQTMGVIRQANVQWTSPIKDLLAITSLITFDLDVINITCFMPQDDPVSRFVAQLVLYPICAAGLVLIWFTLKVLGRPVVPDSLFNLNGRVLLAVYIALALMVLLPFQCSSNPGGETSSMLSQPGITCWSSPSHQGLVALAMFGILAYPLGIFGWILWTTLEYPAQIAAGKGLQILRRYHFLFNNFRADAYYYGAVMLARNLLIVLVPVVFVNVPVIQLVVLCFFLAISVAMQSMLLPWRTMTSNRADLFMTLALIIFVVAAAPLLEVPKAEKERMLGIVMLFPLLCIPLLVGPILAQSLYIRLSPGHKYAAFLCHHKSGAGSLGRFIKLTMARHSSANVFYDADHLEDLDSLFDLVRSRTKALVVLVSPEVQKRMWCAGEIVTAHQNNIPIILLSLDMWKPLDASQIETVHNVWTEEQKNTLVRFGITVPMVGEAYLFVLTLPQIEMDRYAPLVDQETSVLQVMSATGIHKKLFSQRLSRTETARVVIVGAVSNAEALATCQNLQILVQEKTLENTTVLRQEGDVQALAVVDYLVVVLSRNILLDPHFAALLLEMFERRDGMEFEVVTVNGDSAFEFPHPEFLKEIEAEGLSGLGNSGSWTPTGVTGVVGAVRVMGNRTSRNAHNMPDALKPPTIDLGPPCGPRLAEAYGVLLSSLALPLSPYGSEHLMRSQVKEICTRFHNLLESKPSKRESPMSKSPTRTSSSNGTLSNGGSAGAAGSRPGSIRSKDDPDADDILFMTTTHGV